MLDPVGNLEVMWEGGANPKTFTFDAADRLETMALGANVTTFTLSDYGALASEITGSQTTTYTYDGQDQLIGVLTGAGVRSTYTFDGDGMRRTAQEGNVQPTTMVWDGSDYLFLDGPFTDSLVLTLDGEIVACGARDLLTDPLGTLVREISAGASLSGAFGFYPYGSPVLPAITVPTIPFRYIAAWGYFFDTNDRDYVRARELEKRLGRWLQTDPIWPNERAFGYVRGMLMVLIDPFGRQSIGAPSPVKVRQRDSDDGVCVGNEPPCSDLLDEVKEDISDALMKCLLQSIGNESSIFECLAKHNKKMRKETWEALREYLACVMAASTCVSTIIGGIHGGPRNPCGPPFGRCAQSCCYMEYLNCMFKCTGPRGSGWGLCIRNCRNTFEICLAEHGGTEADWI